MEKLGLRLKELPRTAPNLKPVRASTGRLNAERPRSHRARLPPSCARGSAGKVVELDVLDPARGGMARTVRLVLGAGGLWARQRRRRGAAAASKGEAQMIHESVRCSEPGVTVTTNIFKPSAGCNTFAPCSLPMSNVVLTFRTRNIGMVGLSPPASRCAMTSVPFGARVRATTEPS